MNRPSFAWLAVALSVWCAWSPAAGAADSAKGQQLYRQNCAGCHAVDPTKDPNGTQGVRNGAGSPATIRFGFAAVAEMIPFNFGTTLAASAPDDLAAYLATVFGGTPPPPTPGQLQLPLPVAFGAQTVGTQSSPITSVIRNVGGSSVTISSAANSNAVEFPVVSSTCAGIVAVGGSCQISAAFVPFAVGVRNATITVTGTGTGSPQSFSLSGSGTAPAPPPPVVLNYEGLWWNSPAGSESGWGINFAHQGDVIFVTWFTYDLTGKAWWLSMTANKVADGVYSGTLIETHGPRFNAVPFLPSGVAANTVGSATLTFSDANNGSFAYTVSGVSQTKSITRQVFAVQPTCTFGGQADLTHATNYQDLWWAAPAGVESGWGVNFTHQSNTIFATWFTYDFDGTPLWLSATIPQTGSSAVYAGTLYRTTGPPFNAVPFLPAQVALIPVGTLTVTFASGNNASYAYTVTLTGQITVTQIKTITRQVFRAPGTVCG